MSKITCSGCKSEWTGEGRCHCTICHVVFGGESSFTKHRRGKKCLAPEELGLVDNGHNVWVARTEK